MRTQHSQDSREIGLGRTAPKARRGVGIAFYGLFALLLSTNVLTGLGLYFTPEINSLFRQDNSAQIAAYQQRIVQLRLEVDRLHSRQYAQMGDLNLQVHDLVQQQETLFEQHQYVRMLTDMARELGLGIHDGDAIASQSEPGPATTGQVQSDDLPALLDALYAMQEETRMALVSLSDVATLSTREMIGGLEKIGLSPRLPEESGLGGPFIPAQGVGDISIIDEVNAVATALKHYGAARDALSTAPIQRPLAETIPVTSSFGNRRDPFLGRTAFHAGIDFRAPSGTAIRAAADGEVVFAGRNGGYGNMVDIDHGNGFVTRYAHLNSVGVSVGQAVNGGDRLGQSGSTGRSTGPHLHFEVRRNDTPVNPATFLEAGKALKKFL